MRFNVRSTRRWRMKKPVRRTAYRRRIPETRPTDFVRAGRAVELLETTSYEIS
jgi:hypothetical protein